MQSRGDKGIRRTEQQLPKVKPSLPSDARIAETLSTLIDNL